ncbi:MAG: L,D-transpeptidase [candidate division WOR-3 bacterium]
MPVHLTSFLLLLFSFFLFFLGELIFPLERSIRFNIIARGKAIINYRKGIKELKEELKRSKERLSLLESEAESLKVIPEEDYLVIDLLRNRLFWKKGEKTLREILISTGRGDSLISGKKKWVFKTPTGILRILWKIKNPIWYKPDWAFLEEKKPIPPPNSKERLVRGMLGDYALDLGGGILIHGTPYEHLLGRSVSHGCIRVGKEDIKFLYENCPVGMKVYIYGR